MTNPFSRHQKLNATLSPTPENPYRALYGLRDNPFPALALYNAGDDPRVNGEIYDAEFRAEEERQFFDLFVKRSTGDDPVRIGFLRLDPQAGGRGNGKSIFLHRMMMRLNARDWPAGQGDTDDPERSVLALHLLPSPRSQSSFHQLLRLVFETLCGEETDAGRPRLVQQVDREIRSALLVHLLDAEALSELAQRPNLEEELTTGDGFPELLADAGIDAPRWRRAAEELLLRISPMSQGNQFVRDLVERDGSVERTWRAWRLHGRAGSDPLWRKHGSDWFANGLVPALMLAGYRRLYVLLDEFEKIYVHQTTRQREEFLDLFRQVFYERDSVAVRRKYVVSVLSIHPSIETYLQAHWQRVGLDGMAPIAPNEIARIAVTLGPATPRLTQHLLVTYMDHFRVPGDRHRGAAYPFESDALTHIMDKGRYYPRNTLRYAHLVLQHACAQQQPAPITGAFAKRFLDGTADLPDEDDEQA